MAKSIIIFDGECNLCNGVVDWLFKSAPDYLFQFIPFQSPKGQVLLSSYGFSTCQLETVILIDDFGINTHSDGFLKIISKIPHWKFVATLFSLVPKLIRDFIYNKASKNRMKWFGKSQSCTISF